MLKQEIDSMGYVDLLSYIEETNRCPGGKRTITKILNSIFLPCKANILEIGSNTGFTSIELAKLIDANIIGIDINENAVKKSKELLKKEPELVQAKVDFQVGNAVKTEFRNDTFDLIITGGANTFIDEDKRAIAIKEYKRLLRENGFLAITNLFYSKPVPAELLDKLEKILSFRIKPWKRAYWLDLFLKSNMELFSYEEVEMQKRNENDLKEYVNEIIDESFACKDFANEFIDNIKAKWYEIMKVFNDNHEYLSFMIVILRNNPVHEQRELFIEKGAIDPWTIVREEKSWDEY